MISFKTKRFLSGIKTLSDAVGLTLGPKGLNVAIDKGYETIVLHDGVSVAKVVSSKNKYEDLGIKIVREASLKQVKSVGDGTTVTIVLANAIVQEAQKLIESGISPMSLRREIEMGADKLVSAIEKYSNPVKSLEEAQMVAKVSAEDEELGNLVGEVIYKTGTDGVVSVEESKGVETVVEYQDGMRFDKGYLSSDFITDPSTGEAVIENAEILITEHPITDLHHLANLLNEFRNEVASLVVIAPEVGGNALASFVMTKKMGNANLLCVGAPLFGDKQRAMLADIAILTGGQFISKDFKLPDINRSMLGKAQRVVANQNTTMIVGGMGKKKDIEQRIASIKSALKNTESEFEKAKLTERLAKLTSGVAVIRVGGSTEIEMKERKERVLDAVAATKAALEEGIVAGGEVIYNNISSILGTTFGEKILKEAIKKPFDLLMVHANLDPGRMRLLLELSDSPTHGVDVMDGVEKDMFEAGIIDPAKVSKEAIRNSVSVANQILTTGCVIINQDDKSLPSM